MPAPQNLFQSLSFRYPFRKYQRMVLEQMEQSLQDRKFHIVAPPGSGKTIIGLELIRRLGAPAVVFAPTTTIQVQWYQKVGLFLAEGSDIEQYASMDPSRPAPIRIFTYQLISNPDEAQEHLREAGLHLWKEELLLQGRVTGPEEAEERLAALQRNNPEAYRKDLLRYANRVKRRLLREEGVDIAPYLHPNARQLIENLIAQGVQTVVLDECHHLLDYWAIVLRYLIGRIQTPHVIGLTATLPSPEGDKEFENYNSLLGEVDFEVPTPAVVKEGDLAPYRDLLYLVKPTPREYEYLRKIQGEFEAAITQLRTHPRFLCWLQELITVSPDDADPLRTWQQRWDNYPLLMLAAVRVLHTMGELPAQRYPVPAEAYEPVGLEDWAHLLERFGLDGLKLSADPADHELLRVLRRAILPFGLTLTERGMQQTRSPGDLVLTFSESKDYAVAHILAAEAQALGERLRAVVVTDFERVSSGVRPLKEVLAPDAGSALRVFTRLVHNRRTRPLVPLLVTGRCFYCPAEAAEGILQRFAAWAQEEGLRFTAQRRTTRDPGIVEIDGEGPDWGPRAYVRLATRLFEQGFSRCLVGTRGIFGEGWDALSLNTLIDLTSVTTSTSVQQLRGRTLRLDPNWPRKVAHHWDVVCVAPGFRRGQIDLERFLRRHSHYWSLVIYGDWLGERAGGPDRVAPPHLHGKIARGAVHVRPELMEDLLKTEKGGLLYGLKIALHNRRTMDQIPLRDWVYDLWEVGAPYTNFTCTTTMVQARELKIRTVFTLQQTLARLLRDTGALVIQTMATLGYAVYYLYYGGCLPPLVLLLLATIAGFVLITPGILRTLRTLLTAQVPDAILLDVGRALLHALRDLRLVSPNLQPDYVRVVRMPDETYQVLLDYASPEDAATFIQAFGEIFEPVSDQRYLIKRTEDRLPNLPLRLLWLPLRTFARRAGTYPPAYHPVPKILATRKERAELFARYWARYVGGGELVFTRSEPGRAVLLQARAQRRPRVKQMAFELWR
ncbi:MAG: DEAD/DEAH box helicase family protein [Anaerolineae bacterium]|nr:DEAD/DEAH box helicase family protein [Anaerolineae bacterium]